MHSREIKKRLQSQYDRGVFASRQAIIDFGQERGWVIYRNTLKYITFQFDGWEGKKKRARIKIDFQDEELFKVTKEDERKQRLIENPYSSKALLFREPHSLPSYDIRWVYVIYIRIDDQYFAYVGHTSTISTRLKGHLRSKSKLRSSGPLQVLASNSGATLKFAVVDVVHGKLGRGKATSMATNLEGFWTERARASNVQLPGVEGWGQFPTQPEDPDYLAGWGKVLEAAKPINRIIAKEYDLNEVCVSGIDTSIIRKRFEAHRIDAFEASLCRPV